MKCDACNTSHYATVRGLFGFYICPDCLAKNNKPPRYNPLALTASLRKYVRDVESGKIEPAYRVVKIEFTDDCPETYDEPLELTPTGKVKFNEPAS